MVKQKPATLELMRGSKKRFKNFWKKNSKTIFVFSMITLIFFAFWCIGLLLLNSQSPILNQTTTRRTTSNVTNNYNVTTTYLTCDNLFFNATLIHYPSYDDGYWFNDSLRDSASHDANWTNYRLILDPTLSDALIHESGYMLNGSTHYTINAITIISYSYQIASSLIELQIMKTVGGTNFTIIEKDLYAASGGFGTTLPGVYSINDQALFELNDTVYCRFIQFSTFGDEISNINYRFELAFYDLSNVTVT